MSHARTTVSLLAATVAALGLAGCTPWSTPTAQPAADTTSAHGAVPSEPSFHANPEPSTVATDSRAPSAPVSAADVPVLITFSGYDGDAKAVVLGGVVSGVIESGGTCTATLTRNGRRVTASGDAEPDASSTDCSGLSVPGAQLSSGTWSAVLTYRSATHTGSSDAVEVDVP